MGGFDEFVNALAQYGGDFMQIEFRIRTDFLTDNEDECRIALGFSHEQMTDIPEVVADKCNWMLMELAKALRAKGEAK